jgi:hypothetical protein
MLTKLLKAVTLSVFVMYIFHSLYVFIYFILFYLLLLFFFNFTDFKCIVDYFSKPTIVVSVSSMAYRVVLAQAADLSREQP